MQRARPPPRTSYSADLCKHIPSEAGTVLLMGSRVSQREAGECEPF